MAQNSHHHSTANLIEAKEEKIMLSYFKCVKTGCDILCGDNVFHGDLFHKNGVYVLVCSHRVFSPADGKRLYYHFEIGELAEVPSSSQRVPMMLCGKPANVDKNFLAQLIRSEGREVSDHFSQQP